MTSPIMIGNYEFEFQCNQPRSEISDYDYDGFNRFPSTYINHLIIRDQIMKNELMHIIFHDKYIYDIQQSIRSMSDNFGVDNNDPGRNWASITIEIPQYPFVMHKAMIIFARMENGDVNVAFMNRMGPNNCVSLSIQMNDYDLLAFYDLFEI